jgi:hypothetical protein
MDAVGTGGSPRIMTHSLEIQHDSYCTSKEREQREEMERTRGEGHEEKEKEPAARALTLEPCFRNGMECISFYVKFG